jgi:hypothetical protein
LYLHCARCVYLIAIPLSLASGILLTKSAAESAPRLPRRRRIHDRELANSATMLYNAGKPLAPAEMRRLLDRYGPSQGYWAYYARIATVARV